MRFQEVRRSLADLTGRDYVQAVCRARAFLGGEPPERVLSLACDPVDFWPDSVQQRLRDLLPMVGSRVCPPLEHSAPGAGTDAFAAATRAAAAPLSGFGWYRVGEDGRLWVISKAEHYHAALGHGFPGFRLLDRARELGIPNATHNNTRGHITRLLETALLAAANAGGPGALDRVLNLETGSLAVEAALKLVLARFYAHVGGGAPAVRQGRQPVLLVVGDDEGRLTANYHGTTILTQVMRGLWPDLGRGIEEAGLLRVRAVRPNRIEDVERALREEHRAGRAVAAFFHEIVMMNYGARVLTPEFLQEAHALCRKQDVATVVDEIQSCAWYAGGFLFRHWGIAPDMVALGKGFPGGEYPASRLLFRSCFDVLPQFGALVTNGQEEIASLAYLVTMAWSEANAEVIAAHGRLLEQTLRDVARAFPAGLEGVDGAGHLLGFRFRDVRSGRAFAERMNEAGYDLSVQTYKAACPPVALCKLPVIADEALIEVFARACRDALGKVL